jgi:hypothetical protein
MISSARPASMAARWEARVDKDAVRGMLRDLGVEQHKLTDTTKLQIRTAASLAVQVEQAQARALKGERVDLFHFVRMQNSLSRTLWAARGLPQEAAHRSSRSRSARDGSVGSGSPNHFTQLFAAGPFQLPPSSMLFLASA